MTSPVALSKALRDLFLWTTSSHSRYMPTIERKLQLTLHELEKWCDRNGFKFSITKTVGVHFCNRRALHPDPALMLNKAPLPFVPETKFLGVFFDKKLTFIPHLKQVRTKCNQS